MYYTNPFDKSTKPVELGMESESRWAVSRSIVVVIVQNLEKILISIKPSLLDGKNWEQTWFQWPAPVDAKRK